MSKKLIRTLLITCGTTAGAYYVGTVTERHRLVREYNWIANDKILWTRKSLWENVAKRPALPLFGTVSAATSLPAKMPVETPNMNRLPEIMKYGFPSLDHVRPFSDHVLSYDRRNRVPHWVFEHLTAESLVKADNIDRVSCDFRPDEKIHPFFRAENSDYKNSGYDRGHMAAFRNHCRHHQYSSDTFYLSNVAPQVGQGFNRDAWNSLEKYVRSLVKRYTNVYVCTGPLFLPKRELDGKVYVKYQLIGANGVAVPTHYYKIIVCERTDGKFEMESYIMPNQAINNEEKLRLFQVPPESIERAAGLLFFNQLNRDNLIKINGKSVESPKHQRIAQ